MCELLCVCCVVYWLRWYCWQKAFLNGNSNPILCTDNRTHTDKNRRLLLRPYILVRRIANVIPTTFTLCKLTSWACALRSVQLTHTHEHIPNDGAHLRRDEMRNHKILIFYTSFVLVLGLFHAHSHIHRKLAHTEHPLSRWARRCAGIHSIRYMCVIGLTLFYVCTYMDDYRSITRHPYSCVHTPWARRIIIISSHLSFISNGKSSSYIFYFANSISRKHMILPRTHSTQQQHGGTKALRHRGRYVQNVLFHHPNN